MAYSTKHIADWFLSHLDTESGDTMSPLKLQKLLYYAQAWHLTLFEGEPLFNEGIQAWRHGPVAPSQYARFADLTKYAPIPVDSYAVEEVRLNERAEALLNDISAIYGEHQASYLEKLSHSESPWIEARGGLPLYAACNNEITHRSMIDFYSKKAHDGQQEAA